MKQRKDGRWAKAITINDKRVFFYSSEDTEKKAEKDIQNQLINYTAKQSNGKTFKEVAGEWERQKREQIPDTTWKKCYRAAYNSLIKQLDGTFIKDITAKNVDYIIKYMASKNYSQKTISNAKCVLNMIFDYSVIEKYVDNNFVSNIKLPHGLPKTPRKMPSDEDIKVINQHWDGFDMLPYFLLYSGLRISEALALSAEDIDFKNKTITVNKKIIHDGQIPDLIWKTKTEAGERTVILLDRLADKIKKRKGILFPDSECEGYYRKWHIARDWERWQKKRGVSVTAHQLRHAYATMLYESGIDAKTAQNLMGHADIKLTLDIYTDIRQKHLEKSRTALNNFEF